MIELIGVHVNAGKFQLKNLSMKLETGKFHVLLGPSGVGKSVLLEMLVGLLMPSSGELRKNGIDITHLKPENRGMSYLPQDNCLFPHLTVLQNILFGPSLQQLKNEVNVSSILVKLQIEHLIDRDVTSLSGGEQQRVALARALALGNDILILDEPTSSLQEHLQEKFCMLLSEIQKEFSLTILMTTHNRNSALMVADELHYLIDGQLYSNSFSHNNMEKMNEKIAELNGVTNVFEWSKMTNETYFSKELNVERNFPNSSEQSFRVGVKPKDFFRIDAVNTDEYSACILVTGKVVRSYQKDYVKLYVIQLEDSGIELFFEQILTENTQKLEVGESCELGVLERSLVFIS
jgi:ABC-type Fe3+/spermidine/putrescine transport system ATPase subunit